MHAHAHAYTVQCAVRGARRAIWFRAHAAGHMIFRRAHVRTGGAGARAHASARAIFGCAGDFEVLNLGTWEVVQRIRYQVAYPVLLP